MYGFDQVRDKSILVGSELLQICIGENEVIMNFSPEGDSIMIFGFERFISDNRFMFEAILGSVPRVGQIGKRVTRFNVINNETACIIMSDGSEIILKDDSADFESVTLRHQGHTVVI